MNVIIRPAEIKDVPGLLRLVEEYWRFEDISDFDPAQVTFQLERLARRSGTRQRVDRQPRP